VVGVGGVVGTTLVLVGLGYQVALVVIPVGMLAAYLVLAPESPARRRFLWFTVGSAMALCLGVEIIVLKGDIGRMNTVFKFYLQVWMLLSIAAAVSLAWVREYLGRWKPQRRPEFIEERPLEPAGEARLELAEGSHSELAEGPRPEYAEGSHPEIVEERRQELAKGSHPELVEGWRSLWWIGMGLLIFGGALLLPYGVRARAVDRMAPQTGLTLDGMAFMAHGVVFDGAPERGEGQEIPLSGDYAAIRWMQDHIQGSPVIMEGLGYREYLWGNRVSIHTGLPAVIGWRWHQVQQRLGVLPDTTVDWRREDVRECYDTTDVARALEILDRYGVRYVYVGAYERAYYDPAGLAKFDAMAAAGVLRVVYDAEGTKIYQAMNNDQ
jgi:uncharacterized membrane protein